MYTVNAWHQSAKVESWRLRCRTTSQPGNREKRGAAGRSSESSTISQLQILCNSLLETHGRPFPISTCSPAPDAFWGRIDCSIHDRTPSLAVGNDEKESARNVPVETGTEVVTGKHGMTEGRCANDSTGAGVDDASDAAEIGEKIDGVNFTASDTSPHQLWCATAECTLRIQKPVS